MAKRKIIPYNPKLKEFARQLRNDSTKTEIFLWMKLKGKQMYGYDFHLINIDKLAKALNIELFELIKF